MTELFAPPAAVVGGSVVSFASGLPASHREDVYMSTAFAQNATRAAFEAGLSGEWFEYYCNQLRFLGWDVPRPQAFVPEQGGVMAGQAINRISTRLGADFAWPMSRALKQMERNASASELFDSTVLRAQGSIFQLIPCVMNGPNRVDMGVYHRQFKLERKATGILFLDDQSLISNSLEQMALISFNTLHYGTFREKVKKSVLTQSLKYLSELEL